MSPIDAVSLEIGDILICDPDIPNEFLRASELRRGVEYRILEIYVVETNEPDLTGMYIRVSGANAEDQLTWRSTKFFIKKKMIN